MQSKRINWVFGKTKLCMSQNIVKKVKKITHRMRESLQIIVCLVYYRTLTSQYKWLTLFAGSKASLWIFLRKVHKSQTYTVDIFIEKGTHMTNMYLEKVYFYQLFGDIQDRYIEICNEIHFIPSRISMIKKMESKSRPGIWRNVANSNKKWANTCGKLHGRDSSLDS